MSEADAELDTGLAALRDELHTAITPPDLADIGARARRRGTRRRTQVGAVVAVLAASLAVPLLRALPDGGRPPARPHVPAGMTFQVDFADPDHAYALGSDCVAPAGLCALALFASADGGRSWARRALPGDDERYAWGDLSVVDERRLVVARHSGRDDGAVTRVVSADAGRTWRTGAAGGPADPAPLPVDAALVPVCAGEAGRCRPGVGAMGPDGVPVPAPSQPPLVEPLVGTAATAGGRFWAAGVDRVSGGWAIAVSSDRGGTWTTTPVEVPGEPMANDAWAVVEGDGVLYATLLGSIAKGPFGLLSVFRSTDGGRTWETTFLATRDTVLTAALGSPVATADGRLLVHSATTGTHESRDGGRTFTATGRGPSGAVAWTRGGYVAAGRGHAYALSADGIGWRPFGIG